MNPMLNPTAYRMMEGAPTEFPAVTRLARDWQGVPATSTPSERVSERLFYICGIVNTVKRSRMSGKSLGNMFLYMETEYPKSETCVESGT